MNYFYSLAQAMRKTPDAELSQIVSMYERAGKFAALAAPYRHGRLSAIKLLGDPSAATGGFKPDATLEELREELGKRVLAMAHSGVFSGTPSASQLPMRYHGSVSLDPTRVGRGRVYCLMKLMITPAALVFGFYPREAVHSARHLDGIQLWRN